MTIFLIWWGEWPLFPPGYAYDSNMMLRSVLNLYSSRLISNVFTETLVFAMQIFTTIAYVKSTFSISAVLALLHHIIK